MLLARFSGVAVTNLTLTWRFLDSDDGEERGNYLPPLVSSTNPAVVTVS